jgi:phage shock protein E
MKRKPNVLLIVLLIIVSCTSKQQNNSMLLKPKEFNAAMLADKDYILLDCRTPEEVSEGALKGNININFHDDDFKQQIDKLDRNKTVYIYCRSGNRSHKSAVLMGEMKFKKVVDLNGGIVAWKEEGLPVE